MCADGHVDIALVQFALQVARRVGLASFGQRLVEGESAVGRSVGRDFHGDVLIRCITGRLHAILPSLQLAFVQLVRAQFGLLDEEEDVGVVRLLDDALELVRTDSRISRGGVGQLCGGDHAVGNLDVGQARRLVADLHVEGQVELRTLHLGFVLERRLHGHVAARSVSDGLVVGTHLFALEGVSRSPRFAAGVAQDGRDGQRGVLFEPLGGVGDADRHRHLSADGF